jgi:hypothetical protein
MICALKAYYSMLYGMRLCEYYIDILEIVKIIVMQFWQHQVLAITYGHYVAVLTALLFGSSSGSFL